MRNLTFTLFFLSFFLSVNAQELSLQLTHEDDIVITNSRFHGRLYFDDSTHYENCQTWGGGLLFLQYDNTGNNDFLSTHSYQVEMVSNLVSDGDGFSKIAIVNQGGFSFSDGTTNNIGLNIGRYNHSDGSILPLLSPQSNIKMPQFRNTYLIEFPNGDWGIVGDYYDGDFLFPGMTTALNTNGLQVKSYILKFDGMTNQVVWQKEMSVHSNHQPAVASNGDIYITGYRNASDTVTLGNLTLLPSTVSSTSNFYMIKMDEQGNLLMLKDVIETDVTSSYMRPYQFHLQDSTYYIVSEFDGQTTFSNNDTLAGSYSFIAKYQANNDSLLWLRDLPVPIKSSALDFQNNLYFLSLLQYTNWTLDSINFYNENQFIGVMNDTGGIKAINVIPNSGSNFGASNLINNQFLTNSQGKVYGLLGEMGHYNKLLLFEVASVGQLIMIDNFDYESCFISTQEENLTVSIKIAPNPATDFINITIEDENYSGDVFYRLYNANGQLLRTETIKNQAESINIQDLPSGLYFTEVITNRGSVTKKVVKL
ncbi:MAG: T9SS type A sorting domain-containing protein [Saprospiraceae bacterium]